MDDRVPGQPDAPCAAERHIALGYRLARPRRAFFPAQPNDGDYRTDRMAGADRTRDDLGLELAGTKTLGRRTPRHDELHTRQRAVALHVRRPTRQPAVHHVAGRPAHGHEFPAKPLGEPLAYRSRIPPFDASEVAVDQCARPAMADCFQVCLYAVGQRLAVLAAAHTDVHRSMARQSHVDQRIARDVEALR